MTTKKKKPAWAKNYITMANGEPTARIKIKDPVTGETKIKSQQVSSQSEANDFVALMRAQAAASLLVKGDPKMTISTLANWYKKNFLVPIVRDKNQRKVRGQGDWYANRGKLDKFVEHFGGRPIQVVGEKAIEKEKEERSTLYEGGMLVSEITSLVLEQYVEHRVVNDNVVISTTNRDMAMIRNMFIEGKDVHGLKLPKFPIDPSAEHERTVTITLEQERLLLATFVDVEIITVTRKGKTYQTKSHCKRSHLRPFVIAAIDTALRAGELRKLTWDNVDLDRQVINILYWIAKVPKTREVPISDRLKEELEKMSHRTGQVFVKMGDYKRSWTTALKRAGIPKGTRFHDLRHTGTTQMVESGVPVPIAMKITGHTQNKTFNRYVNPSTAAIQNAGKQLQEWRRQQEQVVIDAESKAVN